MDFKDYLKLFDEQSKSSVPDSQFPDIQSTGQDNTDRQKLVEDAVKAKRWALIPQAIAGAGDTLSAANKVYGGPGTSGAQENVNKEVAGNIEGSKTQFESGLQNNPESDASKQYQNLLGRFLGKDPTQFAHMSASQIKDQIPAIEKLSTMQNQKSMKELGMAQLASQRDQANADRKLREKEVSTQKEDTQDQKASDSVNRFVEGELRGRAAPAALQSMKVDSAIHAKELLEGARNPKTGKVELNQVQLPELAMNLTNLITGSNTSTLEQFRDMKPKTLKQYIVDKASFMTGQPMTVSTEGWVDSLNHILDRQGAVSEDARNQHINALKERVSASYPKWYERHGEDYFKSHFGNSYKERYLSNGQSSNQSSSAIPTVGSTYNGAKVLKVTRIQ